MDSSTSVVCDKHCSNFDYWLCSCGAKGCNDHFFNHIHTTNEPIQIRRNPESCSRSLKKSSFLTCKNIFFANSALKVRNVSVQDSIHSCLVCFKENRLWNLTYSEVFRDNQPLINLHIQKIDSLDSYCHDFYDKFYRKNRITTISRLASNGMFVLHAECSWDKHLNKVKVLFTSTKQFYSIRVQVLCIKCIHITHDCKKFVIGSADHLVSIWSVKKRIMLREYLAHENWVSAIVTSYNKIFLITGSFDKTVRVWDFKTSKQLAVLRGHSEHISVIITSFDDKNAISGSADCTIRIWSLLDFCILSVLTGHKLGVSCLDIFPDKSFLVSGGHDSHVFLWNLTTFQIEKSFEGLNNKVLSVNFFCDHKYIFAPSPRDKASVIWSINDCKMMYYVLRIKGNMVSAAIDLLKKWAVLGLSNGEIFVFDLDSKLRRQVCAHTGEVSNLYLSKDNCIIVSASVDEIIKIWQFQSLCLLTKVKIDTHITTLFMSDSNKFVLAYDSNKKYKIIKLNYLESTDPKVKGKKLKKIKKNLKHVTFSRKFHLLSVHSYKTKFK